MIFLALSVIMVNVIIWLMLRLMLRFMVNRYTILGYHTQGRQREKQREKHIDRKTSLISTDIFILLLPIL
jgi:hypothetical protein